MDKILVSLLFKIFWFLKFCCLVVIEDRRLKASVGTAISAVCPAHYLSDIILAKENNLSFDCVVDHAGILFSRPTQKKAKSSETSDSGLK